ncbi:MAG: bifunctional folylpolyglutamate synthase/dihydrofolate synthase [Clostridiaceae bacterium]|nr:bifunctional folylpolyglutamate synthase/dihydrofolate synthase [Clostridiaceae bacterium]
MTYHEALAYIEGTATFGGKPGLRRIRALCERLGNPQDRVRVVHITGTNGKGSTAAMTASVLKQAGYRVGLFVSPYVDDFRERIQFNGELIAREELVQELENLLPHIAALREQGFMHPTQFEMETAMAFSYFARKNCDFAVIEAGVGGLMDCTNLVKTTEVAVLTSISLDHTAVLGPTVADIARDKCGIIKNGCDTVMTPYQPAEAVSVIEAACRERGARLTVPDMQHVSVLSRSLIGSRIRYDGMELYIPMAGEYQIRNAVTVVEICRALQQRGAALTWDAIAGGISAAHMPGRFETVRNTPLCILDGGHNPGAIEALCRNLDESLNGRRLIVVMGMFADKDYVSCVKNIASRADLFIATSSGQPRSQEARTLAGIAKQYCHDVCWNPDIAVASRVALGLASHGDVILVCGSIYNIAPARAVLAAL